MANSAEVQKLINDYNNKLKQYNKLRAQLESVSSKSPEQYNKLYNETNSAYAECMKLYNSIEKQRNAEAQKANEAKEAATAKSADAAAEKQKRINAETARLNTSLENTRHAIEKQNALNAQKANEAREASINQKVPVQNVPVQNVPVQNASANLRSPDSLLKAPLDLQAVSDSVYDMNKTGYFDNDYEQSVKQLDMLNARLKQQMANGEDTTQTRAEIAEVQNSLDYNDLTNYITNTDNGGKFVDRLPELTPENDEDLAYFYGLDWRQIQSTIDSINDINTLTVLNMKVGNYLNSNVKGTVKYDDRMFNIFDYTLQQYRYIGGWRTVNDGSYEKWRTGAPSNYLANQNPFTEVLKAINSRLYKLYRDSDKAQKAEHKAVEASKYGAYNKYSKLGIQMYDKNGDVNLGNAEEVANEVAHAASAAIKDIFATENIISMYGYANKPDDYDFDSTKNRQEAIINKYINAETVSYNAAINFITQLGNKWNDLPELYQEQFKYTYINNLKQQVINYMPRELVESLDAAASAAAARVTELRRAPGEYTGAKDANTVMQMYKDGAKGSAADINTPQSRQSLVDSYVNYNNDVVGGNSE